MKNNQPKTIEIVNITYSGQLCTIAKDILKIGATTTAVCPNADSNDFDFNSYWSSPDIDAFYAIETEFFIDYPFVVSTPSSGLDGSGIEGDPFLVTSCLEIHEITNMSAYYQLTQNINCSASSGWTYRTTQTGLRPIGALDNGTAVFTGSFDGANYTISNILMNSGDWYVGLIRYLSSGVVQNVHISSSLITGTWYTGGLVGFATSGSTITNSSVQSTQITGSYYTGGLVGYANSGSTITDSSVQSTQIVGYQRVGGFMGGIELSNLLNVHVIDSFVNGTSSDVGGLSGSLGYANVTNSSVRNSVVVAASNNVGGLIGFLSAGYTLIESSFVLGGSVYTSAGDAGGLVGDADDFSNIRLITFNNTYSTTNVTAASGRAGGLTGHSRRVYFYNSYATGAVSGTSSTGGITGQCNTLYNFDSTYYNNETTGMTSFGTSCGSPGYTTGQSNITMKEEATFVGWDFTNTWGISESTCYPFLQNVHASCP